MPESIPAVQEYDARMRRLTVLALAAGRKAWRSLSLDDLSRTGEAYAERLATVITQLQVQAARAGAVYSADALAQQGTYSAPLGFVDPAGFVGVAPDGRPLASLLYSPVTQVKTAIGRQRSPFTAMRVAGSSLDRIVQTVVSDAGRAAAGVDIATRPGVGYTRMLNLPSCPRCVVLAGRFYRWNKGFQRHPRCDCRHIPSTESIAGGVTTDPYAYFQSLSGEQQDKLFGEAEANAIRDGADIFQVINAQRGVQPGGLVTREGTSRRGNYGAGRLPRLTPDGIYSKNLPREDTLRLLETHGYILPGGQNPQGVLVGQREGYGAMGRGGTRVGASRAVEEARRTGVRNPTTRATMTEAERRVFDAQARWDDVQRGVNPIRRHKSLTPEVSARVERDYRKYVLGY